MGSDKEDKFLVHHLLKPPIKKAEKDERELNHRATKFIMFGETENLKIAKRSEKYSICAFYPPFVDPPLLYTQKKLPEKPSKNRTILIRQNVFDWKTFLRFSFKYSMISRPNSFSNQKTFNLWRVLTDRE